MRITIITLSYNAEKTIERTILSVLRQKEENVEYIIIDGGSEDKTLEIISKYRDRIDIIISEKDRGRADAYNKGINLATGELIGIVAADDQLIDHALEKLKRNYDGHSDVISGNIIEYNAERYLRRRSDQNLNNLSIRTSLMHPATFIRKEAYLKYGKYSLQYVCAQDRELLLRFHKRGATFQIVDTDISLFRCGGISTENPCKYAYPEDARISMEYGTSVFKAKSYLYRAVLQYQVFSIIKKLLKVTGLKHYFNRKMINRGYYLPADQIDKLNVL
ncbi:MAG: glycosyltransferase [Bacteroidetes bacterium]|nr:glycosyltransferase [Bacteroidota bacterium]